MHIFIHMYIMYMCIHTYTCMMYVCVCVYISSHMLHVYVYVCVCVYIYACICIHVHICVHMYIHTCTHTSTPTLTLAHAHQHTHLAAFRNLCPDSQLAIHEDVPRQTPSPTPAPGVKAHCRCWHQRKLVGYVWYCVRMCRRGVGILTGFLRYHTGKRPCPFY